MHAWCMAQSFTGLLAWLDAVKAQHHVTASSDPPPYLAMVCCKTDQAANRMSVAVEDHLRVARQLGMFRYSKNITPKSLHHVMHKPYFHQRYHHISITPYLAVSSNSYFTSSWTGDGIKSLAVRLAADLAGIPLSQAEIERLSGAPPCEGEALGPMVGGGGGGDAGGAKYLDRPPRGPSPATSASPVLPPDTPSLYGMGCQPGRRSAGAMDVGGSRGEAYATTASVVSASGSGAASRAMLKGRGSKSTLIHQSHAHVDDSGSHVVDLLSGFGDGWYQLHPDPAFIGAAERRAARGAADGDDEHAGSCRSPRISRTLAAATEGVVALDFILSPAAAAAASATAHYPSLPSPSQYLRAQGDRAGSQKGTATRGSPHGAALPSVCVDDSAVGLSGKASSLTLRVSSRQTPSPTPLLGTYQLPLSDSGSRAEDYVQQGGGGSSTHRGGEGEEVKVRDAWPPRWLMMCCCGRVPRQ